MNFRPLYVKSWSIKIPVLFDDDYCISDSFISHHSISPQTFPKLTKKFLSQARGHRGLSEVHRTVTSIES